MEVKIYTSKTCTYCNQAKEFMKENNIEFEELDVGSNPDARNQLISMGYRGVPVIVVDGEEIQGFDRQRLMEVFDIED